MWSWRKTLCSLWRSNDSDSESFGAGYRSNTMYFKKSNFISQSFVSIQSITLHPSISHSHMYQFTTYPLWIHCWPNYSSSIHSPSMCHPFFHHLSSIHPLPIQTPSMSIHSLPIHCASIIHSAIIHSYINPPTINTSSISHTSSIAHLPSIISSFIIYLSFIHHSLIYHLTLTHLPPIHPLIINPSTILPSIIHLSTHPSTHPSTIMFSLYHSFANNPSIIYLSINYPFIHSTPIHHSLSLLLVIHYPSIHWASIDPYTLHSSSSKFIKHEGLQVLCTQRWTRHIFPR